MSSQMDKTRIGVLVGTGMGGISVFSNGVEALVQKGYKKITPFFIPYSITNMGSALLAIDTGLMGPNYSISTACATANYCFYAAANHIRRGEADIMVVGGTEAAVMPSGVGGFIACRALSQRNEDPKRASRPWDKDRDGFVMGEGSGVLVRTVLPCQLSVPIRKIDFSCTCSAFVCALETLPRLFFVIMEDYGELGACVETRSQHYRRVFGRCCNL